MALTFNTPGVYVQEIPTLPSSVVAVPTAVPVFIGYTEKGKRNAVMDPVRITSLVEYKQKFGGAFIQPYSAGITDAGTSLTAAFKEYTLFTNLQMFYANGGGNCYIISVGNYLDSIVDADLLAGIDKAEQADEPTIVVIPEAVASTITSFLNINNAMLAHCAKMQDRFAILDVKHTAGNSTSDDADDFRNEVGANNLKYGAAYYPPLNTILTRPFSDYDVAVSDTRATPVYTLSYSNLFSVKNGKAAHASFNVTAAISGSTATVNGVQFKANTDFDLGLTPAETAHNLKDAINASSAINGVVVAVTAGQSSGIVAILANHSKTTTTGLSINAAGGITFTAFVAGASGGIDSALYNGFVAQLNNYKLDLHPSSAMAGIFTAVDNDRGVWKAPANVSLNLVKSPSIIITDNDQGYLNVDATGGKSIDAIRNFPGRGILVWGARTLDGNSNEWRYVNVRRLFIMVEESCKKASEFVVFEPNDKNTWIRVKGMISNFLTGLWRDGALAGDKPEQAFFVRIGLGETMTAQDILEGKLIVQIGMAAVRPAEFIILQFEHKLQEA
jgi:hypothetical protein